jgi:hypothetical protein
MRSVDAAFVFASVCPLALGLGCASSQPVHQPPTFAEIREINAEDRIRVEPLPTAGWARRALKVDHIVSADAERIVIASGAGAAIAVPLREVAKFRARRRGRGATIGAGVGAGVGAIEGFFLAAYLNGIGYRSVNDPPADSNFPVGTALGFAAVWAVACSAVGAVVGAIVGAPEDFPLVLGPAPPSPYNSSTGPSTPAPPRAAIVVVPSAEVRSAPFKVAPVILSLTRGERLYVGPTPNAGWRVAFLSDGRVGYIQDAQVEVASP